MENKPISVEEIKGMVMIEFYKCKDCGEEFSSANSLKRHSCETTSDESQEQLSGEQDELWERLLLFVNTSKGSIPFLSSKFTLIKK